MKISFANGYSLKALVRPFSPKEVTQMRLFFPPLMRRYKQLHFCGAFTLKNVKFLILISMLGSIVALCGCGVKGDLIHPSEQNRSEQEDIQNSNLDESKTTESNSTQETL